MDELKQLKAKLSKRRSQLEDAILFFDTEAIEQLKEEIFDLECMIHSIEQEREG